MQSIVPRSWAMAARVASSSGAGGSPVSTTCILCTASDRIEGGPPDPPMPTDGGDLVQLRRCGPTTGPSDARMEGCVRAHPTRSIHRQPPRLVRRPTGLVPIGV
jgi:hypothetical protein